MVMRHEAEGLRMSYIRPRKLIGATAALLWLAGCGEQNTYVAPPPPKVSVAVPLQQPVTRYLEATGNTVAVNSANLVARVQGFVQEINYRDGDFVKKGTVLFVIEPESYRLKLQQSQAAEAGAQATLRQAEADFARQTELASRQVASKAALDNATANRDSAQANLQQAQVNTRLAAINVDYTQVSAPFDGIVSARQVSIGELVGAGSPTVLATIVQSDPIYVNFSISEREVQRIRNEMARRGGATPEQMRQVPVEVGLQTETGYPHRGTLEYIAPTVSQTTGTLTLRAMFANAARALLPGYFVRVRIPGPQPQQSLLVPDTALGSDQGGRYVLVIKPDNVVEQRKVEVGANVGDLRVIESGLKPDDRVVIGGALRAVAGQKVDPQLETIAAAPRAN
jgi:RND family efflux transporter MFP subunit